jgi:hypothetical protein
MKKLLCIAYIICVAICFVGSINAQENTLDHSIIITDENPQTLKSARNVADKYWNAQKIADDKSFSKVTPQELMSVVFDWSYVNQSNITIEKGSVSSIKDDLAACIQLRTAVNALPKDAYLEKLPLLEKIAEHAGRIESQGNRMLGESLRKGYWLTIIPKSSLEAKEYKLMYNKVIYNIELQSEAGTTLKKRITTELRRFVAGSYDSGWKVFFLQ